MTMTTEQATRRNWMAVLARARRDFLETAWSELENAPAYRHLRSSECGMAMVRGRIGGGGDAFNLGEVTVTRCAVVLDDASGAGTTGMSWVLGRDKRHAELAALFDALLQTGQYNQLHDDVLGRCHNRWQNARRTKAQQAAATKVDFFTMVRGENE